MSREHNNNESPVHIDVDRAWSRFEQSVKGEPVPEVWRKMDEASGLAAGMSELSAASDLRASYASRSFGRASKWRKWAVGTAAVCALGVLFMTDWGDRAMAAMLQTFRVQHIVGVGVSDQDISKLKDALMSQAELSDEHFDLKQYGELNVDGGGKMVQTNVQQAPALLGAPVKTWPNAEALGANMLYQPNVQLTFRLQTKPINELIARLGGKTKFPDSANGQSVVVKVPATIHSSIQEQGKGYKSLTQMRVPQIDVPDGLDVKQVHKAVLDLPFIPEQLRSKLNGIEDWRTTFIIPAKDGTVTNLNIAGREAVLTEAGHSRSVVWLDGEWIYQLTGSAESYPDNDSIVKEAKEIAGR